MILSISTPIIIPQGELNLFPHHFRMEKNGTPFAIIFWQADGILSPFFVQSNSFHHQTTIDFNRSKPQYGALMIESSQ
jgi:hypothetical protein